MKRRDHRHKVSARVQENWANITAQLAAAEPQAINPVNGSLDQERSFQPLNSRKDRRAAAVRQTKQSGRRKAGSKLRKALGKTSIESDARSPQTEGDTAGKTGMASHAVRNLKHKKDNEVTTAPSSTRKTNSLRTKRAGTRRKVEPPYLPYPPLDKGATIKFDEVVRLGNGCKIGISGLRDEHGTKYVVCRDGRRFIVTRYDAWHGGGGDASAALRNHGLVVVGGMSDFREAVEKLKRFPKRPIVSKPGWSTYGFVLADGRVLGPDNQPEPLRAFTPASGFLSQGGTLEGWQEHVAAPLADHLLAAFFMMMMFAAPLLKLTNRPDNFGFELSGEAGRGKSTLQLLMASAAGPAIGIGDDTYWRSLNTTMNALETVMPLYSDMPLILDEAGLIQGGGKLQARALGMREMAFRLAAGVVKHRFGEPAGPRFRLVYMLSTNRPILSLVGVAHAAESDAIADRLITIPLLPERLHGIFDHCPPGYASTGAFAEALKQAASEDYGHALPAFLKWLAEEVAKDPKRLRARIDAHVNRFVQRSGTDTNDGSQTRVAKAVGLVYAAGRLAKAAGVLPPSYRCMHAARAALDLHRGHARAAVSFDDRLRALLRHPETIDLAKTPLAELTKAQRARCPVFLYSGRSRQRELLIPIEHIDRVLAGWRGMNDEPDVERRLKPSSDRNTRDRPIGEKGAQRPVYVFDIMDLE